MKPPNVDHAGRSYEIAPRDPSTLEPWLARDGAGNLLVLLGTDVVAIFGASTVAELRAARAAGRQYRVLLEAIP